MKTRALPPRWLALVLLPALFMTARVSSARALEPAADLTEDADAPDSGADPFSNDDQRDASAEASAAERSSDDQDDDDDLLGDLDPNPTPRGGKPELGQEPDSELTPAERAEASKILKLVGIHRLPGAAYPEAKVRGIYGGSLWFTMHGQQWPYMPETGIGISGYGWVSGGYQRIEEGDLQAPNERRLQLLEGRFLLRVTPTYTRKSWFVQTQAEFVANNDQSASQPTYLGVDDLWIRVGMWGRKHHNWDVQFGRFQAWDLFHLGLGLDLNTTERRGAEDTLGKEPRLYGVTYVWDRPNLQRAGQVGNLAVHYYPTSYLRFEALMQYGSSGGQNVTAGRGAAIFDWGFIKIKGGGEYVDRSSTIDSSEQSSTQWGFGGNLLFVVDPWVEFGGNAAYGNTDNYDAMGGFSGEGSHTTWTAGGFANVRVWAEFLVGGGFQYTRLTDKQEELDEMTGITTTGLFAHTQAFASLQYFLFRMLQVRLVGAYARSDINATFTDNPPYSNKMLSMRLQLSRFF